MYEIAQRAKACDVTLSLNGQELEELADFYESYKSRKGDLKSGLITEFDVQDMEDEMEELRSGEQIYSAVVHLIVREAQDENQGQAAQVPDQDPVQEEKTEPKKKPSAASWKATFVLSIVLIILGLILLVAAPVAGAIFAALGVAMAVKSRKEIKGMTGQEKK